MPLPEGVLAPLGLDGLPCCYDCAAAGTLLRLGLLGRGDSDTEFVMARIVVGNERQEQLRAPGAPIGLVGQGLVRPSAPGDMLKHHLWLSYHGINLLFPDIDDV